MEVDTIKYCGICRENDPKMLVKHEAEYLCFECAAAYNVAKAACEDLTAEPLGYTEAPPPEKSEPVTHAPKKRGRPRKVR